MCPYIQWSMAESVQPRLPIVRETEACFSSSRSSEHSQKANGRAWQYSMCTYTLTDSHTNSQVVYEKGRWVCTQAKEHTHLLNVSGGAGILGRGERSCQAFWLNPRGNCDFLLQRTRSRINTHTKLSVCNCIDLSVPTFNLLQTIDTSGEQVKPYKERWQFEMQNMGIYEE